MDRHAKLVWMKEVLEHLRDCQQEWETAQGPTERFLAESIHRDLDEVRRICDSLRRDHPATKAAGPGTRAVRSVP
jgi:hypothetical protein